MEICTVNASIKPALAIRKKHFFSVLLLNVFVNFAPFSIAGPVTYYFLHHYNHLHS